MPFEISVAHITPDIVRASSIEEQRKYKVAGENGFIRHQYYRPGNKGKGGALTLQQQKILMFLISRIKPDDTKLEPQTFDIRDFCEVCGIKHGDDGGAVYRHIRNAMNGLLGKFMWMDDGVTETSVYWVRKVHINKLDKLVTVEFDEDLAPFLLSLKEHYFSFPLYMVVKMRSRFGVQLFQLLKSYCYRNEAQHITFDMDDLKERLDCINYNVSSMRYKVLDAAIADINSYTDLEVSYKLSKKPGSSKYSVVEFLVKPLLGTGSQKDEKTFQKRMDQLHKELGTPAFEKVSVA